MNRTAMPGLLLAALVLSACSAGAAPSGSGGPPGEGGGGGDGIAHPGGAELILSVANRGGFVPVEFVASALPSFTLLGDGRVITSGAVPLIFPGPALPPLQVRQLTEAGIQEVLRQVASTNLFRQNLELRGAEGVIADAGDTVFTVNADGQEIVLTVYALGTFGLDPAMPVPPGVTAAEIEAHRVLTELNNRLTTLDQWLPDDAWAGGGWLPYEPEALRLFVRDATGEPVEGAGGPEDVHEWPGNGDPASFGAEDPTFGNGTRCGVVEGDEAAAWFEELSASTQITRWTTDGDDRWAVIVRPLLPHEEPACGELPPSG
jgi:hypothetical protein